MLKKSNQIIVWLDTHLFKGKYEKDNSLVRSTTVLRLMFALEHRKFKFATGLFGDLTQTTFFLSTSSYPERENIILTSLK